jgi:preprotein translocase subunit YajC
MPPAVRYFLPRPDLEKVLMGDPNISFILMMVLIFAIFYFLLIRPQQKRIKEHREMVSAIRRGDTVVTSGGIIGKVTKVVDESEAIVEIAEGVRVRILKHTVSEVRAKGEPASEPKAEDSSRE